MMKRNPSPRLIAALLLILAIVLAMPAQSNQPAKSSQSATPAMQPRRDAYVVMISIDGLIPEYYTAPAPLGLNVPTLGQMKLNGAYAEGVEGVYPSVTYPSHTTLITGVR